MGNSDVLAAAIHPGGRLVAALEPFGGAAAEKTDGSGPWYDRGVWDMITRERLVCVAERDPKTRRSLGTERVVAFSPNGHLVAVGHVEVPEATEGAGVRPACHTTVWRVPALLKEVSRNKR